MIFDCVKICTSMKETVDLEEVHGEGGRISAKYRELPVLGGGGGGGGHWWDILKQNPSFDVVFLSFFFSVLHCAVHQLNNGLFISNVS